jgi:hypothetical protein
MEFHGLRASILYCGTRSLRASRQAQKRRGANRMFANLNIPVCQATCPGERFS